MLNTAPDGILRQANPVSLERARELAEAIDLRGHVKSAVAWRARPDESHEPAITPATPRRRARVVALAGAFVVVGALLVAPAFGLGRGVLPFFGASEAPQPVQVDFASMNTGAPAGMSPHAIASQTRNIGQSFFAGREHTLWVSPTAQGGFCFEWTAGWGGCDANGAAQLSWNGELVLPPGVSVANPAPQPGAALNAGSAAAQAIEKARSLSVPLWVAGAVNVPGATDVVVRFSDGTSVHPTIVWVSKPIGAGFFSYDVPANERSATNHVTAVDAIAADGSVLKEAPLER
jgi:hypothetical protein